ncbi:MAG TPA: molybdopterin-dependent oxidoreductase [Alphaproteobacteria bacterium]|jgi:anaerobic selenocysteine-containing dehydrogenase|nr:molybdopterin-dependent oxidoreductase [Alphaproteobacteria bacterium]
MTAEIVRSACPHDCPSACALEVERLSPTRIGRIHGARDLAYTAGVVCEKVARYAERVHHPDRLSEPLRRIGAKGEGHFTPISWDDALQETAEAFDKVAARHGPESVWPYHSGGTLGVLQRWGMDRLSNVMGYSRENGTICMTPSFSGWNAGVGTLRGVDPCEIAEADLIVVWGGNPVHTQVNLMSHIQRARKERGAKLVVVDVYQTPTVAAADIPIILRPGTDGALACAMMNVILADGLADTDYLARLTDFDDNVRRHLESRTPAWAAELTGLDEQTIVDFARLYGQAERSFLRLGIGFTRSRNGATNMHAVSCLPALTGAWQQLGGGAFFVNLDNFGLDTTVAHGLDALKPEIRALDQSRIGGILLGDADALHHGPPVNAMLMQNANSAAVAPDSAAVRAGLEREDLFLCVHEQFMTETARYADILLPAAMFLEVDDVYMGWGHTSLVMGRRVLEPFADCRSNHEVICGLAKLLGAEHAGFDLSAWELISLMLKDSGLGSAEEAANRGWIDRAHDFAKAHFLEGFGHADGLFHFQPDWSAIGPYHAGLPTLPDHWEAVETANPEQPFRLVTPPARTYLNSTFSETPTSQKREGQPCVMVHPEDAAELGLVEGGPARLGNARGELVLAWRPAAGQQRGVLVSEGVWPGTAFADGFGVNLLIGGDPVAPSGGAAFHDAAVWIKAETASSALAAE